MTSYTIEQARDAIVSEFETGWTNLSLNPDFIVYQNKEDQAPPTNRETWCRFVLTHSFSGKASLGNANGQSRFERNLIMTVQLFTEASNGLDDATPQGIVDIFEGGIASLPGIWFRNVNPNEIGRDGVWYQTNITADVIYDQIK